MLRQYRLNCAESKIAVWAVLGMLEHTCCTPSVKGRMTIQRRQPGSSAMSDLDTMWRGA